MGCVCVLPVCRCRCARQAVKISTHKEFLIRCAYLEIYNEEVRV